MKKIKKPTDEHLHLVALNIAETLADIAHLDYASFDYDVVAVNNTVVNVIYSELLGLVKDLKI